MDSEIAEARKACNSARRKLKKKSTSKYLVVFATLRRDLQESKIRIKNLIRESKRRSWNELMASIQADPWGLKVKPYKLAMNKLRQTDTPTCESLESFLLSVLDTLFPTRVNSYPEVVIGDDIVHGEISMEEIGSAVRRMKREVAPGPDGFTSEILAKAMRNIKTIFKNVFTKCLQEGHAAGVERGKTGVLIRKPQKPEDIPSSYRPICVLSEIGKLFERVVVNRVERHLTEVEPDLFPD